MGPGRVGRRLAAASAPPASPEAGARLSGAARARPRAAVAAARRREARRGEGRRGEAGEPRLGQENLEGDVALRSSAAVYTYCKSRGLFAGVSLEGTCLIERKETNRKFYGQDIRASAILLGDVPFPTQADDLYEILTSFTEVYENEEQRNNPGKAVNDPPARPSSRPEPPKPTVRPTPPAKKNANKLYPELPNDYSSVGNSWSNPVEVTALYSFEGQQPGDLTFKAGDKITVTTKTDSQFDWWEGSTGGKTGIFPANYVALSNN